MPVDKNTKGKEQENKRAFSGEEREREREGKGTVRRKEEEEPTFWVREGREEWREFNEGGRDGQGQYEYRSSSSSSI